MISLVICIRSPYSVQATLTASSEDAMLAAEELAKSDAISNDQSH